MMIFVLQTIWLYIKELAGKDLDILVVAKFLLYFTPKLIPLVIPLTILLASIMVFGNFAENYEFAAMKSTGISLQRAMAGLSIFIVILGITTFFFSNNVIPWSEYNSYNLRKNIAKLKPAMLIAEGQFNEVGNINLKIAEKSGDRGQYLKDVVIHKKTSTGVGNYTTIIAKTGELVGEEKSDVLQLILFDGNYYDDTPPKDSKERKKRPATKSAFKKYTINVDLSNLNKVDLNAKAETDKYTMLNISDLNYTIDSLETERNTEYKEFSTSIYNRSGISILNSGIFSKKDSMYTGEILDLFKTIKKVQLLDMAINSVSSTKQIINTKEKTLKTKSTWLNRHIMALHDKLALGFACIILFFVGAPLGALIRKGGLGLPMIIAILLFLTYHFIGIFAKNSAIDGSLNPVFAAWFSTLIMLPLGVYLTRRATGDRGLFELGSFIVPVKTLIRSTLERTKTQNTLRENHRLFKGYTDEKLIATLKNYSELGFDQSSAFNAIHILNKRGFTNHKLRLMGVSLFEKIDVEQNLYFDYKIHAKFAIVHYCIALALFILHFVFRNNKLPSLDLASIDLSLIAVFIFIIYYVKSLLNLNAFYKYFDKTVSILSPFGILRGIPLYFITHFLINKKIKEDYKQNFLDSLK